MDSSHGSARQESAVNPLVIKKVAPNLIASKIVSVQPMMAPVGGSAFYTPRYGSALEPIGKEVLFKVLTIAALLWLREQAIEGPIPNSPSAKKVLQGLSSAGIHCVSLFAEEFRVLDGLGQVQRGSGLGISELRNENYKEFLLGLQWRSAFGWPTEMHVLGLAAYDGVEIQPEEAK